MFGFQFLSNRKRFGDSTGNSADNNSSIFTNLNVLVAGPLLMMELIITNVTTLSVIGVGSPGRNSSVSNPMAAVQSVAS